MPKTSKQERKPQTTDYPRFFTPYEAADILQIHPRTVMRRCEDGTIPAKKMGGKGSKWRIPQSTIDKLVACE